MLQAYLVNNSAFMHQNVINASGADPYWYQLSLVLLQLQGVYDGYSDTVQPGQQVPFRAFLNIQLGGDMVSGHRAASDPPRVVVDEGRRSSGEWTSSPASDPPGGEAEQRGDATTRHGSRAQATLVTRLPAPALPTGARVPAG